MTDSLYELSKNDFDADGALRDIYVHNIGWPEWRIALDVVASYPYKFTVDGDERPLPASVSDIFEMNKAATAGLSWDVGKLHIWCCFFNQDEIKFHFTPEDVASKEGFNELVAFIKRLGSELRKPVIVTHENGRELSILRFDPDTQKIRMCAAQ